MSKDVEHVAALLTENRAICRCGWHKKAKGRGAANAAMIRHATYPEEPATQQTVTEHGDAECDVRDVNRRWSACLTHNIYIIPDYPGAPANGQQEMSFT